MPPARRGKATAGPPGPTCMRVLVIAAGLAAALAALNVHPDVRLSAGEVELGAGPEQVIAHLRDRLGRGEEVIATSEDAVVRRFSGRARQFRYATVEVVGFEPAAVTFEHLRGPFAACHERFGLTQARAGSRLTHAATFRLRGGLWTWPFAAVVVRRAFERHVREHLRALGEHLPPASDREGR